MLVDKRSPIVDEEECGKVMSSTLKRRLRRLRLSALKDGVMVPYNPVSQPAVVDKDAPKLTNTAKRNLRRRKKMALDIGLSGTDAVMSSKLRDPAEKKEKKKKKKKKKVDIDKDSTNVSVEDSTGSVVNGNKSEKKSKKRKNDKPGHIIFDDPEDVPDKPVDETKHVSKKKKIDAADTIADTIKEESGENSSPEEDSSKVPADVETKPLKTKTKSGKIIDRTKPDQSKLPGKKRRFVLFVGNLSYDATEEDVREHFSKVGPIVSVRIARELDDDTKSKCRGFCHIDLENEETYLKALSLNHTFMAKRRINVEYSTGQTKELKAEQKIKNFKMKALYKSGRGFEVMNPVDGGNKAAKRSKARQVTQKQGNKFWL